MIYGAVEPLNGALHPSPVKHEIKLITHCDMLRVEVACDPSVPGHIRIRIEHGVHVQADGPGTEARDNPRAPVPSQGAQGPAGDIGAQNPAGDIGAQNPAGDVGGGQGHGGGGASSTSGAAGLHAGIPEAEMNRAAAEMRRDVIMNSIPTTPPMMIYGRAGPGTRVLQPHELADALRRLVVTPGQGPEHMEQAEKRRRTD